MSTDDPQLAKVPVTVLSGFLGAGKSTLLNALVQQPAMEGAAVLINEFGAVGIDHHLVAMAEDRLVLLDSGCVCCSVRGDLPRAFKDLTMRCQRREIPPIRRLLLETTGLADPAPLMRTLLEDFFIAERYRADGIVTVVDGLAGLDTLARHREAVRQVAMADRLLISKCDLASATELDTLEASLGRINPAADRLRIQDGQIDAERVCGLGLYDPTTRRVDVARWLADDRIAAAAPAYRSIQPAGRHDESVRAHVLRYDRPFDWLQLADGLDTLLEASGQGILRIKGLVHVAGEALPRVVQCVGHRRYPAATLPAWPDQDRDTRLVFIVDGLSRATLSHSLAMFCDAEPVEPPIL
ncbi:MAG: GTP-binding protein [Rhodocyclaceae bacterium]|nr:GTP-binding protein [Rhodocyclaceae bacterium]